MICSIYLRLGDAAEEQDAAAALVADEEKKRAVGSENRGKIDDAHFRWEGCGIGLHGHRRRGCRLGAFLADADKGLVDGSSP